MDDGHPGLARLPWLERRVPAPVDVDRFLAQFAHNGALVSVLESLILRTSLIVALYGGPRSLRAATALQTEIVDRLESGESQAAALAMEQCLYAIERELDLVGAGMPAVDVRRAISEVPAWRSVPRKKLERRLRG